MAGDRVNPDQILLDPAWPWWILADRSECTCRAPEAAHHRGDCGITPIYAEAFIGTGQPVRPWSWPWLIGSFPECTCDDERQFCEIHGDGRWLREYAAQWGM